MGINVYVLRETNCYAGYLIRDQRLSGKSLKGRRKVKEEKKVEEKKGETTPSRWYIVLLLSLRSRAGNRVETLDAGSSKAKPRKMHFIMNHPDSCHRHHP